MIAKGRLPDARPIFLDGGTGTEIRARGYMLHPSTGSPLAHTEHPDLVLDVHRDQLDVGAEIVTANTFSLSRYNLEHADTGASFIESNVHAIKLAREAVDTNADRPALVAGKLSTIPPIDTPDHLQTGSSAFQNYKDKAEILAEGGAYLILAEMLLETEVRHSSWKLNQRIGFPYGQESAQCSEMMTS